MITYHHSFGRFKVTMNLYHNRNSNFIIRKIIPYFINYFVFIMFQMVNNVICFSFITMLRIMISFGSIAIISNWCCLVCLDSYW
jgi:hypothetical protein